MPSRLPLLCAAVLATAAASAAAESSAQIPEVRTVARLVATGGVRGHLARPVCANGVEMEQAPFSALAPRLVVEKETADRPFVFDTGGLLTPGGVGRFAAEHMPMDLAFTIDALGYRALVFGSGELAAPRRPMLRALAAIRGRGVPTVATNLYCESLARAVCEVLVDGSDGVSLHQVGEKTLAFLAFLPEDTLSRVSPDRAEGLRIAPVALAMADAVRRARSAGAEIVVASYDPGPDGGTARLLEVAESIPREDRPDILFSGADGGNILFARPMGFRPAIIGASPTGAVQVRVRENAISDGYDVLARALPPSRRTSPVFEPFAEDLGTRYCAQWGRTLRGAELDRSVDGTDMLHLTAGIMRQAAGAEVSIVNRGILDARWQPAREGALTASDIYVALQYDEPLMIAEVEGEWLKELAGRVDDAGLLALGLTKKGDDIEVNGRPLEPRGEYLVVTVRFLAAGGDDALPDDVQWQALQGATLRSVALDYLEEERQADPRDALHAPGDDVAWTLRTNLDASFAGAVSFNDRPYEDIPQSASSIAFGVDSTLRADGLSRYWAWENEGIVRYRTTRVRGGELVEADDRTAFRSTALYRGLRDEHSRFYVPEPYIEGWLESELTVPDAMRDFRHLLLRPTAGLRFSLTKHLKLKVAAGFEYEILEPGGEPEPGGGFQLRLDPFDLISDGARKLRLELQADYFLTTDSQTLRFFLDAAIDLAGPFQLVYRFDLFARRDFDASDLMPGQSPLGVGMSATAAVRVSWVGRAVP